MKICNFPQKLNGTGFSLKSIILHHTVMVSFETKQESSLEICSFHQNRQFSVKKLQTVGHLGGKIGIFHFMKI